MTIFSKKNVLTLRNVQCVFKQIYFKDINIIYILS